MKLAKIYTVAFAILLGGTACDKNFDKLNVNPYALTDIDPGLLFTNAQRLTYPGFWEGEQTIVQQFLNAYNTGATAGFNFNEDNNNFNVPRWNENYPNTVKLIEQVLELTKDKPEYNNLHQQTRIWKSHVFITLVDTYGDVPYSEAGKAYLDVNFYPTYDRDSDIYNAIYNEIKSAAAALDSDGDFVREDLLYSRTASASGQVAQWRKLANSLLLRLGMRYSKLDAARAQSIVQEAYNAGVMTSSADNAYIEFSAIYNNQLNNGPRATNPYFYYLAEPFVNYLKNASDPRLKYVSGKYDDPNQVLALIPDTASSNQFGFPVGYDQTSVLNHPGYRGTNGTGQNYSQLNFSVFGSATAPVFYVTYAQTQLLLAEATHRGWITASTTVQQFYESGIRASMEEYSLYPNTPEPAVPSDLQNAYLIHPVVAFNAADALELINTQYWIASLGNGAESFANFRRSGYPVLAPNQYNNNLQGGFARRFAYPNEESARNSDNYQSAVSRIGADNLTTRVFWDVQ